MTVPKIDKKTLALFYAWLSVAAMELKAKDLGMTGGKYEFRQYRSYQWRYTTDGPDGNYTELSEEPVTFEQDGDTYSFWKGIAIGNSDWTPENFTVQFSTSCTNGYIGSGGGNLDFQISFNHMSFVMTPSNWSVSFDILLTAGFQYKLITEEYWKDCPTLFELIPELPDMSLFANILTTISNHKNDYTIQETDGRVLQEMSSEVVIQLIIDTNDNVPIDIGTTIPFYQKGNGSVVVIPLEGVVVISKENFFTTATKLAKAELLKIDIDTWYLSGDLKH